MAKRFLLAPDSFKGTLSAREVCEIQREAILAEIPDACITMIPMADGGEGITESYLRILGGERVEAQVTGPRGEPVQGFFGMLPDGSAIIEMAAAAGLPLMGDQRDPLTATTFGVGELMLLAKQKGARRILLGLGGSATNDMGAGMAAALGWRFLDGEGREIAPLAKNLGLVQAILPPEKGWDLPVSAACDVRNPLLGDTGATAVYGPQKGVTDATRPLLEAGLENICGLLEKMQGREIRNIPGAGAAGGLGAGVTAFLDGELQPGIDMLLDAAGFDALLQDADVVFTGEGRMDGQSVNGKVPMGVGERCLRAGVRCIALCGSLGDGAEAMFDHGITAAFSAVRGCTDFEEVKKTCRQDMLQLARSAVRMLK